MRDQMLNHGLDKPLIGTDTGYFQVTFLGPGENIERLRVPDKSLLVTQTMEAQLNERQKEIINHVLENGSVTSGWCRERFNVAYQTVYRDLKGLKDTGILKQEGSGRSTRYVMGKSDE